jgi:hypothetical protein
MKSETNEKNYFSENDSERVLNISRNNKTLLLNSTKKKDSQDYQGESMECELDLEYTKKKVLTPKKSSQQISIDSEFCLKSIEERRKKYNFTITLPDIKSLKCNLESKIESTTNENNFFNTSYNEKIDLISSNSSKNSNNENAQSNNLIEDFGSKTKIYNNLFSYEKKRYMNDEDIDAIYSKTDKVRKYSKRNQKYSQEINVDSNDGIVNFRVFQDKDVGLEYQGYDDEDEELSSEEYEAYDSIWDEIISVIHSNFDVENKKL